MLGLGYDNFTNNFLVKQFDNIVINITIANSEVTAITGYDNEQNLVSIPDEIVTTVKNDINNCNE